ncbi:MAG: glycosyl hydrolase [Chloroflexales bacterium]
MSIRSTTALVAALLFVLLPSLPPPAVVGAATPMAQPAPISPAMLGVVVRDPWYEYGTNPRYPNQPNYEAQETMGRILAEAGARWVRLEFIVQAGAGSFEAQIARNDYFINAVAPRYGLKVMGLLAFRLVDVDPRDSSDVGLLSDNYLAVSATPYGGGVNQYMQAWLNQALQIVNRYQDRVAAYEVLNEPNRLPVLGNFAGGEGIAPARVATLHTKLYRCFRQNQCAYTVADPTWRAGVQLVLGGLHPKGSDTIIGPADVAMSDRDYLAALYRSAAFSGYRATYGAFPLDGIGYHPYPAEIVTSLAGVGDEVTRISGRLDALRAQLRATLQPSDPAAAELPFWITEIGYNAAAPGQSVGGQTAFLRAIFTTLAARGDVARVFWFKYEDFPPANGPSAQRWGLIQIPFTESDPRCPGEACYAADGVPSARRPNFWALRELGGLPIYRLILPFVVQS